MKSSNKPLHDYKIVPYDVQHKDMFRDLNYWWLQKYFHIEPIDRDVLSNPEDFILSKGGEIYFAVSNGTVLGTVAMKSDGGGVFELTKLAVIPDGQGGGIRRALCETVISRFNARDGVLLYLETNTVLAPAISLYKKLNFVEKPLTKPTPYERANYYMEWEDTIL